MENVKGQRAEFGFTHKILIVLLILAGTLGYSVYKKKQIAKIVAESNNPILREMPNFEVSLLNGEKISSKNLMTGADRGIFVHFWGTWCAPCEAELPHFINFAKKYEDKNVKFLFLAVNDDDIKIKKFLNRFNKTMPKNILLAHDKKGVTLPLFGTVKVPETYLFNRQFLNVKKFIGPQDWSLDSYLQQVDHFLPLKK